MTLTTAPLAVARSAAANALSDAGQVPSAATTPSNFSHFLGHRLSAADSAGRSLFNNALNAPSSTGTSGGHHPGTPGNATAQAMMFASPLPFAALHRAAAASGQAAGAAAAATDAAGDPDQSQTPGLITPSAFANSAALALGNAAGASSVTAPGQAAGAAAPSALANSAANAITNATANLVSGAPGQTASGQPGSGQPSSGQPGSGQPGNGQPGNSQPGSSQAGTGKQNGGQPGNGQGSAANPRILGAAELNARVAAAAPSYASQPAAAFANALHHLNEQPSAAGPPPPATAQPATADAKATAPPATTGIGPPTPLTPAALAANAARAAAGAAAVAGSGAAASTPTDPKASDDAAAAAAAPLAAAAQQPAAGAAPAAPTPTPLPDPTARAAAFLPAAQQIAVNLKQAVETGTGRIEIQLKPESLGAIDVKLNMTHDGRVSAVISADRSDTLNLLRQNSSGLEQALRNAGLQANSGSLSFNLRGDAQSSYSQNAPHSSGRVAASKDMISTSDIASVTSTLRQHSGALNIEV